ncbi:PKD domain-containing protein [Marixanthomonas spongiae]|uniref:PKD domain-containing protein n=1 Tax=Marixanthomonas spongiae TaxID=2174845 RepID=A0A2U0HXC7_9FLAO|nr:PKD domain-containing protein [Marixanthomonas spongiae]PVW13479.1 hypothetical protein DDV96_12515 [Marixanthomonas spongiae]
MKHLKLLTVFLICAIALVSCEAEIDPANQEINTEVLSGNFSSGPVCDDKPIMKYSSLTEIQNAHKALYDDYQNSGEDVEILRAWEDDRSFYSLRKKDEDMDLGNIPSDPNFDSWSYTSDLILETMLNEDGMIIIGEYLYVWDDGCVIHRIAYDNCSDYKTLLQFAGFVKTYDGSSAAEEEMFKYRNDENISDVDVCTDPRYDFETISELNYPIGNDKPYDVEKSGTKCGLEAHITHDILTHDPLNKTISIKVEANYIAPVGSEPNLGFYISNAADFASIEIIDGSIPSAIGVNWELQDANSFVYPGKWFIIDVDYSTFTTMVPSLLIDLVVNTGLLGGDSCSDMDTLALLLDCPVSISKKPLNAQLGKWLFTLEGLEGSTGGYVLHWDFGDGSPVQTTYNTNTITHTFPTPCNPEIFNVSVTIEKENFCKNSAGTQVSSWDTCKRQQMSEKHKEKYDGRRLKLKIKSKKRFDLFGGGTKIKHLFRYRKKGEKSINSSGDVYLAAGTSCAPESLSSLLPAVSQSGKKRLKQKFKSNNNYFIDLNMPPSVTFTHTNGFSKTLTYIGTCSK